MMKNKELIRHRVDLFLNLVIVLTTAGAVLSYFIGGPDVLGSQGVMCFRYFTTDSNILAAVASLLWLIFRLSGRKVPAWGVVPTAVYGVVYLVMVVFVKRWTDWYGFTFGGKNEVIPSVMAVMLAFAWGCRFWSTESAIGRIENE